MLIAIATTTVLATIALLLIVIINKAKNRQKALQIVSNATSTSSIATTQRTHERVSSTGDRGATVLSLDDLALIKIMQRATITGMTLPSGLKIKNDAPLTLTDDYQANIALVVSAIES